MSFSFVYSAKPMLQINKVIDFREVFVYIKLADNLVPQSPVRESERKQSELLEAWTRTNKVARGKIFRLGSEEMVSFGKDNGLFSAVQAAYNNHWVLRTRPEDWWTSISQTIATRIDKHAKNSPEDAHCCATFLRHLGLGRFTTHEGKKLSVIMGRVSNEEFFQQIISQIATNINKGTGKRRTRNRKWRI